MSDPLRALAAYPQIVEPSLSALNGGLLNTTYKVDAKNGAFVLQSLNKIFKPELHDDIEAVTAHLEKKGLPTTRLVRTKDGALFTTVDGVVWRVLTFILGTETHHKMKDAAMAKEAGALVGRFHAAVADLEHRFAFARLGVHDTPAHMKTLEAALKEHAAHRHFAKVAPLGEQILQAWRAFQPHAAAPQKTRVVHGDLKLSNLLFDRHGHGVCLIDLDTLAHMPLMHELGDAWRSWCNPAGEDTTETRFDRSLFEAAVRGYLSETTVSGDEKESLVFGTALISLELAARFCADALRESYFGWNAEKYPDRSTHNLVRATGQFNLHRSVRAQEAEIRTVLG